ncbi:purine-cytosine permease family protein [Mycobacterium sp. NPDC003449]
MTDVPDTDRSFAARSFLFTRDKSLGEEAAEDYAGRKVPYHWKRPVRSLAITLFGCATSVFAFALGGQIALTSGMPTLVVALIAAYVISLPVTALVMWHTAGRSMDTDLLSRGVGYGYRGSAFTALVYAANFIMYSGFETAYLASAIHGYWDALPLWLWYLITAMIVVPLNWFGISQMHWLQKWSMPIFIVGLIWVMYAALQRPAITVEGAHVGWDTVLPALGAVLANVGLWILVVSDYSRFTRQSDRKKAIAVAGTAGLGINFIVLPLIGGWLALHAATANPGTYAVSLTGLAGLIWVVVTQLRVQEGNYYLGSLSLSTFVSRTFGMRASRPVYLTVVALLAFALAMMGITDNLTETLTFMGVFLMAWVGTVLGSLLAERRRLSTGDTWIEHRRPYLKSWGWPALTGLGVASVVGGAMALFDKPSPYGGFLGVLVASILAPAITLLFWRKPITMIQSENKPPEAWRDAGTRSDTVEAQITCVATDTPVLLVDACEWPPTSGRIVAARVAETE